MFNQINRDCLLGEDQVVPLDNIEYYTQQIMNIYGLEYYEANQLARDMSNLPKES